MRYPRSSLTNGPLILFFLTFFAIIPVLLAMATLFHMKAELHEERFVYEARLDPGDAEVQLSPSQSLKLQVTGFLYEDRDNCHLLVGQDLLGENGGPQFQVTPLPDCVPAVRNERLELQWVSALVFLLVNFLLLVTLGTLLLLKSGVLSGKGD